MPDDARAPISPSQDDAAATRARLIARLREPPAPPGRSDCAGDIPPRAPLGRLSTLLDEIDATVMARTLTLHGADGRRIRLEVCNRRLLRVTRPDADEADRNLTYAGGADLADLRRDFDRLLAEDPVRLDWGPPSGEASLEQSGVSAQMLRQAWEGMPATAANDSPCAAPETRPDTGPETSPNTGPDTDPDPNPDAVARLCDRLGERLLAGLLRSPAGDRPLAGPGDRIAALGALIEHVELSPSGDAPCLTLLLAPPEAPAIAVAACAGTRAALILPAEDVDALAAAWRAALQPGGPDPAH